jgi:DNA-binding HxlR family transcriptional regulator
MIKLNDKTYTCPVDVALGFVGGKWKILILSHLQQFGDKSYSDIRRNLPSISEKMLSQQLKELERDKLIIKKIILFIGDWQIIKSFIQFSEQVGN